MTHAVREALAGFKRAPVLTGLSAAMVGLALFVVGLFGLVAHNLRVALAELENRVEIVVYLREGTLSTEVETATYQLSALQGVSEVRYVSKDDALETAKEELPEFEEVFTDLSVNPLPASLEIRLGEGYRTQSSLERIAAVASAYPYVEEVTYGQAWVGRLFTLRRVAAVTAGVLGAAFAVVATFIIGTALRIAIFARREEIYVMRLVGATDGFIRRPFLLEGGIAGLLGGVLALALTFVVFSMVHEFLFAVSWLPLSWLLAGLAAGVSFGVLSSALSLRRHLKEV